jgi:hypothetical protein
VSTEPAPIAFVAPPPLDVALPGLPEAMAEVLKMRELRLANLADFTRDLDAERGPVTEDELRAVREEWFA